MLVSCVGPNDAREGFLLAKAETQEKLLTKLDSLPHQHANLVLRTCLQQNLRRLQRSLHFHDLKHPWKRLNLALQTALTRIREGYVKDGQVAALIDLPIKIGGLGFLSFVTCAPLAFAFTSDASDAVLSPLFPGIASSTSPEVETLQKRRWKACKTTGDTLLESLDLPKAKVLLKSSVLGRKKLSELVGFRGFGGLAKLLSPQRSGSLQTLWCSCCIWQW
jgi:hypothetical protein